MATFELYRRSTIGMCLTETLDEMVQSGTLSPELAIQVLVQFDKAASKLPSSVVNPRIPSIEGQQWLMMTSMAWQHGASMLVYPLRKKPMISFEHVLSSDREPQQSEVVLVPSALNHNLAARSLIFGSSAARGKSLADVAFSIRNNATVKRTKTLLLMPMLKLIL
uniref:Transcription initiation factor IIA gamma subunit N-terminal domain-containing protein n=1 Tax=Chenopodium quinoa TaxID=63459 RepID=A0A803LLJ1_CHEQI